MDSDRDSAIPETIGATGVAANHLLDVVRFAPHEVYALFREADGYAGTVRRFERPPPVLARRTLVNLFFENSTRTRASFELAALRLGANVINITEQASSVRKGETVLDTAHTLRAMRADIFVVRHPNSGAVKLIADKLQGGSVVNAGDGAHAHPTQALLDGLTLWRQVAGRGRLDGLCVAICGDVRHSRVARSNIKLLKALGVKIHLIGPRTLVSPEMAEEAGASVFHNLRDGLRGVDVIMLLRLQLERMRGQYVPSVREYFRFYGLTQEKLAAYAPNAFVMHPGPMNRGVEIDSRLAENYSRSLIQDQVEMGVAIRMACLAWLIRARNQSEPAPEEASLPGEVNLGRVNLGEASLGEATLGEVSLEEVALGGASFRGATLVGATLGEASFPGEVNLEEANLGEANLEEVALGETSFRGATLEEANLEKASLEEAPPSASPNVSGRRVSGRRPVRRDAS